MPRYLNNCVNRDDQGLFGPDAFFDLDTVGPQARKQFGFHSRDFCELRLKGAEGIAWVFYCTLVGKRVVMLHSFIKKSAKTPRRELEIARGRTIEVKHANP